MFHNNCDNYAQDNDEESTKPITLDLTHIKIVWNPETGRLENFEQVEQEILAHLYKLDKD